MYKYTVLYPLTPEERSEASEEEVDPRTTERDPKWPPLSQESSYFLEK